MEQATTRSQGQMIFLSRNSKLARLFQDGATTRPVLMPQTPEPQPVNQGAIRTPTQTPRAAVGACSMLQSVNNPTLELNRPLAAALMREQAGMRCRARGVLLDNEYVRDICAAGAHQHCPFLK